MTDDYAVTLGQGLQTFSLTIQRVNIFGFVGHMGSVIATQLTCCRMKGATDDM